MDRFQVGRELVEILALAFDDRLTLDALAQAMEAFSIEVLDDLWRSGLVPELDL